MDAQRSLWRGRRVLVTGCTGLLGGAVTRELLDRGATVVGLVRQPVGELPPVGERFRLIRGRAEDAIRLHSAMAVHEVSAVFHLASVEPFAVLRAAALYHPRIPVVTARPTEQLRLAADTDSPPVPLGVARFGELFGRGDRNRNGVVARTVLGLLEGRRVAAPAGPSRDFVFARDAAQACLAVAETVGATGQAFDGTFRSGWELSDAALATLIADVFGGRGAEVERREGPNPLGWQPVTPLAVAISETIRWYRESMGSPRSRHRRAA